MAISTTAETKAKRLPKRSKRKVAIARQGGGSHTAFTAGFLMAMLDDDAFWKHHEIVSLSGTSGGPVCAALAWSGILSGMDGAAPGAAPRSPSKRSRADAFRRLEGFWGELSSTGNPDQIPNVLAQMFARLPITVDCALPFVSSNVRARMTSLINEHYMPRRPRQVRRRDYPRLNVGAAYEPV
ncbi:hypothetical protein [Azospirillum sp. sgz302134]